MKHKSLVDKILEHSGDSIIVISLDGVILSANSEALDLLEFSEEELIGKSHYWFFFNQTQNQVLGEMINDGFHKSIEHSMERAIYITLGGVEKSLKISTALLKDKQSLGTFADRESLVVFLKQDKVDSSESSAFASNQPAEMRRLQRELEKKQSANEQLSVLYKRFDFLRIVAVAAIFAIFAIVLVYSKSNIKLFPSNVSAVANQSMERTVVTAQLDSMVKTIRLAGIIEPYNKVSILARTSGKVVRRRFQEGEFVQKDEILYRMDTQDLAKNVRSARVKYIELLEEYNNLVGWDSSLVVMQAKRKFQLSKIALNNERKKLEETKKLFDKGIIPRVEYEKEMTGYKKAEFDYENAKQGLDSELDKGNADYLEVVKLKLDNASEELDEIEARYEAKLIRAPVAGIIMRPELRDGKIGEFKDDGDTVSDGDMVATVGATQSYLINSILGELQVKDVKLNGPVTICGPAFPDLKIAGKVNWIATSASIENQQKYFPIRISFSDLPDSLRGAVRIGMRAEIEIQTEELKNIVTIPIQAVSFINGKEVVFVENEAGSYEERVVDVGMSDMGRIQINSGLIAGENVLVNLPGNRLSGVSQSDQNS